MYSADFVLHDYAMYEYFSYHFSLVFFYKTCIQKSNVYSNV